MSFSESIVSAWNKAYRCFEGRARRSEYWFFTLFAMIMAVIPIVNLFAGIALFIPGLSVAVRRLHDTGRSGWWLLLGCLPIIGTIILIIFFVIDSEPGDNEYGPNPKGVAEAEEIA